MTLGVYKLKAGSHWLQAELGYDKATVVATSTEANASEFLFVKFTSGEDLPFERFTIQVRAGQDAHDELLFLSIPKTRGPVVLAKIANKRTSVFHLSYIDTEKPADLSTIKQGPYLICCEDKFMFYRTRRVYLAAQSKKQSGEMLITGRADRTGSDVYTQFYLIDPRELAIDRKRLSSSSMPGKG